MRQTDWVGQTALGDPFQDIRNQREAVAQEKARLVFELSRLIKTIPPGLAAGGSVNHVRKWKAERSACQKVCDNKRSSVVELEYAIRRMRDAAV